jgi:hypothetical protein
MDMDFIFYSGDKLYVWSDTHKCVRLWSDSNYSHPATATAGRAGDNDADLGATDTLRTVRDSGEPDSNRAAD